MTTFRDCCATCGSRSLDEIIDLGMHAMADTFVPEERMYEGDRVYPLICDLCPHCKQIQLRAVTDPGERYNHFDYSYTSSNSSFSRNHWTKYAEDLTCEGRPPKGSLIVEVGSNDGYLCERFATLGFKVLGIDPSRAMNELAAKRGVDTQTALFSGEVARKLAAILPERPRLIIANNVFNHANEPLDFARGVSQLLAPDGTFVFELPYFLRTILDGKFDQIYHEHVSYFTVTHARNIFKAVGMVIVHADEVDYHGGSIRVFVRHDGVEDDSVEGLVSQEEAASLFDVATYHAFMTAVALRRDTFMERIYQLRQQGARIVCVGAAAKANTFMSYYNLNASVVDWVTDASPNKINKFTPLTRVRIKPDDVIADCDVVYAIITSWNLAGTLKRILTGINPNVRFLDPYETH